MTRARQMATANFAHMLVVPGPAIFALASVYDCLKDSMELIWSHSGCLLVYCE